ncbi:hypothetical protein GH714_012979 [Hevea brasiliensis]|uniref:AAA+ ATPase domain-containing protein n=1 Tax=Hevea brasiliensis TaxID=3981 RepID=A0A6A6MZZ4_HEVBR|nr:hypothetical protein GH714_012979 [Hevea brasiliensis]
MEVLVSIFGKIGECLVEPIGRQFGYCILYQRNIDTLSEQVQILEAAREGKESSINTAKRNGQVIRNEIQNWTSRANGAISEATELLQVVKEVRFLDLISRYRLGRKVVKKVIAIKELRKDGEFPQIMEALKDERINFIGIHGMGGVGKTTLVKEIAKEVEQDKLFDAVVMAVVSQTISTITEEGRARLLTNRLKKENKTLIILDDIWKGPQPADIGIPFGSDHMGCKIMITTRHKQVCNTMAPTSVDAIKIIQVDVLSEQESWSLLKSNAGHLIESPTMNSVAKEICKECGGLPIAIVTIGRAMRGKDLEEWKETALELKKAKPLNIEGVNDKVYNCLKLSYDYLEDEEAKFMFQFCCLFPEDFDILIEDLVRYGIGLGIFEDVRIQKPRNRARSIINNLKEACLL